MHRAHYSLFPLPPNHCADVITHSRALLQIKDLQWPFGEDAHRFLTATKNGGRRLSSAGGSGYVELHGHKQTCDISFSVEMKDNRPSQHCLSACRQSIKGAAEVHVCVIVQRHSVVTATAMPSGAHQWWQYPLSILLGAAPSPGPPTSDSTQPGVIHGLCSRTQLHKWMTTVSAWHAPSP